MQEVTINIPSSSEGRPRLKAGWRILIFVGIFYAFSSSIFLIRPLLGNISKSSFLSDYSFIIVSVLAVSATLGVYLCRRLLDRQSFVSLGLRMDGAALRDLGFGFLLSGLMAGLFFLLLMSIGALEVDSITLNIGNYGILSDQGFVEFMKIMSLGTLFILLLEHILVGYWEELVFRGYLFQNMIQGMGMILSIAVSCLLYGLIHAFNPNATLLSSVIIMGFGFLRLYGYLTTKMLWLSIGMHIGWNFFQGPIFGFGASGHQMTSVITHEFTTESDFLTGASFGPEGSILIIPIVILAGWCMKAYSLKFNKAANDGMNRA